MIANDHPKIKDKTIIPLIYEIWCDVQLSVTQSENSILGISDIMADFDMIED